jgi:hypothetical protein
MREILHLMASIQALPFIQIFSSSLSSVKIFVNRNSVHHLYTKPEFELKVLVFYLKENTERIKILQNILFIYILS